MTSTNPIIPDDAFRSAMPADATALRMYLETLKVGPIRDLAAKGMPLRHESKKAEMIEWLVRNIPAEIRQHRDESRSESRST
jgi:hypothetical protein